MVDESKLILLQNKKRFLINKHQNLLNSINYINLKHKI